MPRASKIVTAKTELDIPKTMSIPEAGAKYYGLSKNGSYDAAARGEIPFIKVGKLKRVPVVLMDRKMEEAGLQPHGNRRTKSGESDRRPRLNRSVEEEADLGRQPRSR